MNTTEQKQRLLTWLKAGGSTRCALHIIEALNAMPGSVNEPTDADFRLLKFLLYALIEDRTCEQMARLAYTTIAKTSNWAMFPPELFVATGIDSHELDSEEQVRLAEANRLTDDDLDKYGAAEGEQANGDTDPATHE